MDIPAFTSGDGMPELGTLIPVVSGAVAWVLRVPANEKLSETVRHAVTESSHLLIVAENGSDATVEVVVQGPYGAMEVLTEENATLTIVCIQESSGMIVQRSAIGAGASVRFQNVTLSERSDHDLKSETLGAGAFSTIDWIFYARRADTQKLSARNIFSAGNGGGEITLKGVAEEQAHVRCDGLIDIGQQGGGTNTFLSEDVLMLDATAKVDAIPGLQIKTNDVRASHSATVSKVTPEDLFYFASRGIDFDSARHMYVLGFLADLTGRIADAVIRESVCSAIETKYARDVQDSKDSNA